MSELSLVDVEVARSFVVDGDRRIVESTVAELPAGDMLTPSSWLGQACLDAIDAAAASRSVVRSVARDCLRGTVWILVASVADEAPRRARVVAIDATPAVADDRDAVFGKLVHTLRNVSFALLSLVEAFDHERPTGAAIDAYVTHLRTPVARLSATSTRLGALIRPPSSSRRLLLVDEVVEHALSHAAPQCRPERVTFRARGLVVMAASDELSQSIRSMLESGGVDAASSLEVDRVEVGDDVHARVVVEISAGRLAHEAAALWDLAAGHGLEASLGLALARNVVLAHGGAVMAEDVAVGAPAPRGRRVRLGVSLPLAAP